MKQHVETRSNQTISGWTVPHKQLTKHSSVFFGFLVLRRKIPTRRKKQTNCARVYLHICNLFWHNALCADTMVDTRANKKADKKADKTADKKAHKKANQIADKRTNKTADETAATTLWQNQWQKCSQKIVKRNPFVFFSLSFLLTVLLMAFAQAELPNGTSQRNLPAEPPGGTSWRKLPAEPPSGTLQRNLATEPPKWNMLVESWWAPSFKHLNSDGNHEQQLQSNKYRT